MKKLGRFLTNTFDPTKPNAKMYHTYSIHAMQNGKTACDMEWQHHLDYINSHVIGPPSASDTYTVEELEAENMIGIYAKPETKPD